jgi:hypothetical protein
LRASDAPELDEAGAEAEERQGWPRTNEVRRCKQEPQLLSRLEEQRNKHQQPSTKQQQQAGAGELH